MVERNKDGYVEWKGPRLPLSIAEERFGVLSVGKPKKQQQKQQRDAMKKIARQIPGHSEPVIGPDGIKLVDRVGDKGSRKKKLKLPPGMIATDLTTQKEVDAAARVTKEFLAGRSYEEGSDGKRDWYLYYRDKAHDSNRKGFGKIFDLGLVIVKPNRYCQADEIITRFIRKGYVLVDQFPVKPTLEQARLHYDDAWEQEKVAKLGPEKAKELRDQIADDLASGWIRVIILAGRKGLTISGIRRLIGPTDPSKGSPGEIRFDFSHDSFEAADNEKRCLDSPVHAADCEEAVKKEIRVWGPCKR